MSMPMTFVYVVLGTCACVAAIAGIFGLFGEPFDWIDVAGASFASMLASLLPFGGTLAIVVLAVILNWRCRAPLWPDIAIAVLVARVAIFIALLLVVPRLPAL